MWRNVECMVRWLMISPESFKVCLDLTRHDARASQPNKKAFSFARHPPFIPGGALSYASASPRSSITILVYYELFILFASLAFT